MNQIARVLLSCIPDLYQQLEGNLIYPRVVGSSLGLPAIWVLVAVTICGGVMGISFVSPWPDCCGKM